MFKSAVKRGLPYQGGKGQIADWIYGTIFSQDDIKNKQYTDFYDLFCGGGAITEIMLVNTNIPNIHANDITVSAYALKWGCANANKPNVWENILHMGAKQEYLKYWEISKNPKESINKRCFAWWCCFVWGFSGRVGTFGYSLPYYLNELVCVDYTLTGNPLLFNDFNGSNAPIYDDTVPYIDRMNIATKFGNFFGDDRKRTRHRAVRSALCLPQRLARRINPYLKRLIPSCGDYRNVEIQPNSLVYLDPPYKGTYGYKGLDGFDSNKFYSYAESLLDKGCDVFCSEMSAPSNWQLLGTKDKLRSIGSGRKIATECLYRVRKLGG